jgi:hypothetical protein
MSRSVLHKYAGMPNRPVCEQWKHTEKILSNFLYTTQQSTSLIEEDILVPIVDAAQGYWLGKISSIVVI